MATLYINFSVTNGKYEVPSVSDTMCTKLLVIGVSSSWTDSATKLANCNLTLLNHEHLTYYLYCVNVCCIWNCGILIFKLFVDSTSNYVDYNTVVSNKTTVDNLQWWLCNFLKHVLIACFLICNKHSKHLRVILHVALFWCLNDSHRNTMIFFEMICF